MREWNFNVPWSLIFDHLCNYIWDNCFLETMSGPCTLGMRLKSTVETITDSQIWNEIDYYLQAGIAKVWLFLDVLRVTEHHSPDHPPDVVLWPWPQQDPLWPTTSLGSQVCNHHTRQQIILSFKVTDTSWGENFVFEDLYVGDTVILSIRFFLLYFQWICSWV